jgi:hypothetical protein
MRRQEKQSHLSVSPPNRMGTGTGFADAKLSEILSPLAMLASSG